MKISGVQLRNFKRFTDLGILPAGYDPARTLAFLESEIAKWGKVITDANVKIE